MILNDCKQRRLRSKLERGPTTVEHPITVLRKACIWKSLATGLALLCWLPGGGAITYYVSIGGKDTNPGSAALPWRTIEKAANSVQAGDRVTVLPGDYDEVVNFARDATPTQPIMFRSSGAEVGGFNCRKSDYIIQGFRINGTNSSSQIAPALVYVYANAHRLQVLDNYFHDSPKLKYAVLLERGANAIPANSSSFNVISNNTFASIDYINISCNGVSNKFLRNIFRDSNGQADCFRLWGDGHIAADNLVTNLSVVTENHTDFFQVFGPVQPVTTNHYNFVRNIVLERNIVVNSRIQICQLETFDNPSGYMTNLIFRNNLFINLPYAANVDMDGTKWYNNLFYRCNTGNGGHVFALGGPKGSAWGTDIKNNIFFECGNRENWVGWYPTVGLFGITNFDVSADYNFVCGSNFDAKRTASQSPTGWGGQGQEAHGINGGDPRFVSIATSNFRPASGSFLINAGTTMQSFADDLLGQLRTSGSWEIGPYEYQNLLVPSAPANLRVVGTQ